MNYVGHESMIVRQGDCQLLVTVELSNGAQMDISSKNCYSYRVVEGYLLKCGDEPISFLMVSLNACGKWNLLMTPGSPVKRQHVTLKIYTNDHPDHPGSQFLYRNCL